MFGVSKIKFCKEIYYFIQQRCSKLVKSNSKDIYNVNKNGYFR